MNAPLRVPTNTRTLLIFSPFRDLRCSQSMFYMVVANSSASSSVRRMNANCFDTCDKFFCPARCVPSNRIYPTFFWELSRNPDHPSARDSYARCKPWISIFFILSIASMTLFDFSGLESCSISPKIVGLICHDRPYLSFSQPHGPSSPPCESFSQNSSTSPWVLQFTENDMASVNLNWGPPFRAMNCSPSSSNTTVITEPLGPGPASP